MDMGLVSGLLGAQMAQTQTAIAAKMLKMNAQAGQAVAQLLDAAQQSANSLANVASGIGANLDISV
ncbi:MAG: hypothetical protein J0H78_13455 [Rhizobiales bacterium]|nr:hypothetical protein [Hyphomicrobiales bacterium]OJY43527.1 MAG: hypothetical protein BGP08_01775 [Rhizobiales bacterium 64-17]